MKSLGDCISEVNKKSGATETTWTSCPARMRWRTTCLSHRTSQSHMTKLLT
jgi:hypothetical protein